MINKEYWERVKARLIDFYKTDNRPQITKTGVAIINKVLASIITMSKASKEGVIYAPEYKEIKDSFKLASQIYNDQINATFEKCREEYWKKNNLTEDDWNDGINNSVVDLVIGGLPSMTKLKAYKKTIDEAEKNLDPIFKPVVDKAKNQYEDMKEFVDSYNSLKGMVVKGARPKETEVKKETAPENNENRGTCACCFSNQAYSDKGVIVSHGYKLPEAGFKTDDCVGTGYPPFEVSDAGTKRMVVKIVDEINKSRKLIDEADDIKELIISNPSLKLGEKPTIKVDQSNPFWDAYKQTYVTKLENGIKKYEKELEFFEKKIDEWNLTYGKVVVKNDGPGM